VPAETRHGLSRAARRFASVGLFLLLSLLVTHKALTASSDQINQWLTDADRVKSSDYTRFASLLNQVDVETDSLSSSQRQLLAFLRAWQRNYTGEFDQAIVEFKNVIDHADDEVLRTRAGAAMINAMAIARRYSEAYSYLDLLVERLPQIGDAKARDQILHVAALLNNEAGQYELALDYSAKLLSQSLGGRGECMARQLLVQTQYELDQLEPDGAEVSQAISVCERNVEPIFTNFVRVFVARRLIDRHQYKEAAALLGGKYDEIQATRYPRLTTEVDVLLAQAFFSSGDIFQAKAYALRVVDRRVATEVTDPLVSAYKLLYQVALQQGDERTALSYHEKYAEADRKNIDDVSARSLAYQMVRHQSIANRLQIETLNKQNQVLQLEQQLGAKAAETSRLYIALLVAGLLMVFLWAFHTKRRQLHFRRLSQQDGLTGVDNRPHFLDIAQRSLDECRRGSRECTLILFDLDHFKMINDRHGHAAGDIVLKQVSAVCRTYLRPNQYFGRIGGEEFALLLVDCGLERAQLFAEQLRQAVAATNAAAGLDGVVISASFGVAAASESDYELRQLMARADAAMYVAKRDGRNRVVVSHPDAVPLRLGRSGIVAIVDDARLTRP